ncbi:MAG TPA: SpoIID/LytB domain-containing protein [Bryobacteraceae bacterium]|nr:SpoIID/LytB domain-containing protein [Bryobacteraceae bacterium]
MVNKFAIAFLAVPLLAADLRIGVLSLFRPERVTVRSTQVLWVQAGQRAFFLNAGQVAGLRAVGAEIDLFAQQQLTASKSVKISGRGGTPVEFSLGIEGKIDRKFTGRLEVTAVGARLEPVILVDLESAVAAAVAAEMTRDAPHEALKAMAVLARSYYTAGGRRHGPYDFCDTTHCQWRRETIPSTHPAFPATNETNGIVVTYKDQPFAAMYHASCGGETKTAEQVGLSSDPYPYFSVACEPCRRDGPVWSRKLPADIAQPILTNVSETLRLAITRQLGWSALPSNNYKARLLGAEAIVDGRGEGHGVGVCQRGLIHSPGRDFRELLSRYLPQTRAYSKLAYSRLK